MNKKWQIDPHSKDTVLVVVDMQNGFLTRHSKNVVGPVLEVVRRWNNAGGAIVFTQFFNRPESAYQRLIGWYRLQEPPETDICQELLPYATTVIKKETYGPFTCGFAELVAEKGWKTIVLCGVATDGCVLKTATDAFERGLVPLVIKDACASHAGTEIHEMGLVLLERFIGRDQMVTVEDIPQ